MPEKESRYAKKLQRIGFTPIPRELTRTFLRANHPEGFSPNKPENPSFIMTLEPEALTFAFDETGQGWIAHSAINLGSLLNFENKTGLFEKLLKIVHGQK